MIGALCRQAVRENAAVPCFYLYFASEKDQFPAATQGSVLKQVVGVLGELPEEIIKALLGERGVLWWPEAFAR